MLALTTNAVMAQEVSSPIYHKTALTNLAKAVFLRVLLHIRTGRVAHHITELQEKCFFRYEARLGSNIFQ